MPSSSSQRRTPSRSTSSKSAGRTRAPRKRAKGSARDRSKGNKSKGTPSRRRWVWVRRTAVAFLAFGALGLLSLLGLFAYYGRDLPEVATLHTYEPPQTTRILDRSGNVLGEVFSERRTVVPMDRVPRVLIVSVLAAEDADFYQHEGLDYPGIVRALLRDLREGRAAQGASTITQQVVKLLLLTDERTLERKVRELILARRLEQELSKDEILALYLNTINFGHGRYGVQEASRFYFGKDVEALTLAEASLIAGIPQAPARLSPRSHPDAAKRRQAFVLRQLEAKREAYWPDILVEDIRAAREHEVPLVPRRTRRRDADEIMPLVRRMLREQVGEEAYRRGGFTVHTTLSTALQRQAREALQRGLEAIDERQRLRAPLRRGRRARRIPEVSELVVGRSYDALVTGTDDEEGRIHLDAGGQPVYVDLETAARYNPDELPPSRFAEVGARTRVSIVTVQDEGAAEGMLRLGPQGAIVAIDPRTRHVLAVVGSYEGGPGFNRALQAIRQPGSTFKPLVYALGIRSRTYTPATVMIDAPAVYDQWRPQNYETWAHEGPVRLREALARSINLVAVRAIEEVGPAEVVRFAEELGIESDLEPTFALALGASAVSPLEMTNAYATFGAGGRWAPPIFVTRIEDAEGHEVPLPERDAPRDVLSPAEAYVVTSMLQSVVREGTARRAGRALDGPAAGKTGTSNEARDAWFVGYTPSVAAGVWVGFDHRRSLGRRESGGRSALPIWIDVIKASDRGRAVDFPRPSGVETAQIDPATGLLAPEGWEGAIEEVFVEGTAPTEYARSPDIADPTTFLMEQFGGDEPPNPERVEGADPQSPDPGGDSREEGAPTSGASP